MTLDTKMWPGDDDDAPTESSVTVNKNRLEQNAIFDAWVKSETGKQVLASPAKDRGGSTEPHSLGAISAYQQKDAEIIRSPRTYQIELFERAKQRNTIAVLDTGSGKTLIAILLLRWVIENELENRSLGRRHRVAFFLVPAVNLVFQQHSVLERNLDFQIGRLCGADGVDAWKNDVWKKLFSAHHAIVCTAEILHICLSQGFINIDGINLLILDEAHHSKGNHPYAKIMKDFYHTEKDPTKRPHVFGMTASPVDGKGEVKAASSELEYLLDSRIATTSTMSLSDIIKKPQESYANYARAPSTAYDSRVLKAFKCHFDDVGFFAKPIKNALEIAKTLGSWFADAYILDILSDEKQASHEINLHKRYKNSQDDQALEKAVTQVRDAVTWAKDHSSQLSISGDVVPKVTVLEDLLRFYFGRMVSYRCIVFVEQRSTARLLHTYFEANRDASAEHMVTGFLTGARWTELDELKLTHRKQMVTLMKFRNGDINCLFATQVAEEGLDVADCNLIIRFDLCKTMIQYVQSRGRARNRNSHFVHMLENGNPEHMQRPVEARAHESIMKQFCEALPADRYLHGEDDGANVPLQIDTKFPYYIEPLTSAKLSFGNALGLLANFVSSVPADDLNPHYPEYMVERHSRGFVSRVFLPMKCPISSVLGNPYPRRILAKQSAAFETCVKLRLDNYIDEHLRTTYRKELPAMRNALLGVNPNKKHQYTNRTKPDMWSEGRGTMPSELWMTVIRFVQAPDQPLQPLILLTRTQPPQFPDFPIFPPGRREKSVVSTLIGSPLVVTSTEIEWLGAFTLRVFRDVFSKTFENNSSKLSYWMCPYVDTDANSDPRSLIDWALLREVYDNEDYIWTPEMSDEFLVNKFIFDPWNGGRKFYSKSINKRLKSSDPVPDGADTNRRAGCILDYSSSLWTKTREKFSYAADQPVIEALKLPLRLNLLAPPLPKELDTASRALICPEPLRISTLPPSLVDTLFLFPAIIHRFESYLISIEGCRAADIDCKLDLALAAFTKDSDNSGDWLATEPINFQHGMGENYERLEFIGDTFLKLTTSLATFIASPNANEFESHVERMLMLCNKNLFRVALDLKLYEYIRSTTFSRRLWYPEGIALLAGKGAKKDDGTGVVEDFFHQVQKQALADKTIADVSEALIGAVFVTHDRPGKWHRHLWDSAVRTITKLVDNPHHSMTAWLDYTAVYVKPTYQVAAPTAIHRFLADRIFEQESYRFNSPRLLYSAFLHPSNTHMAEGVPSYQRLEFLGDALLDLAAVTYLFHAHPSANPQWLTEHKTAMVSNRFLGALCVLVGFHTHIRHTSVSLQAAIATYAAEILHAKSQAGGDGNRDFWVKASESEPPKCLADVVEAYVAALFIDADFDYAPVQGFFDAHIRWFFEDMTVYDSYANSHPVRRLETAMRAHFACVEWRVMAREVEVEEGGAAGMADVAIMMVHGQVVAACKGKSPRHVRAKVAGMALEELEGLHGFEFRTRFGCTCGGKE